MSPVVETSASDPITLDDIWHRLVEIDARLTTIAEVQSVTADAVDRAETIIAKVAQEVGPTIDGLKKSPLIKMLGVK